VRNLVDLARRYVELADELEGVRTEIKKVVMNGSGDHAPNPLFAAPAPARVHRARPGATPSTEVAEQTIIATLQSRPGLKTSEVAEAVGSPVTSTVHRLRRLREKGTLQGGGNAGWQVAVPA